MRGAVGVVVAAGAAGKVMARAGAGAGVGERGAGGGGTIGAVYWTFPSDAQPGSRQATMQGARSESFGRARLGDMRVFLKGRGCPPASASSAGCGPGVEKVFGRGENVMRKSR